MTKQEFLQILREELSGRVPASIVQENLNYYSSYITSETTKGKTEEQVTEELGSPRLIARTILDAAYNTEDRPDGYSSPDAEEWSSRQENSYSQSADRQDSGQDGWEGPKIHYLDLNKWYVRLGLGLAVFCIIALLVALLFGMLSLAGWVLSVIWPVLLIIFIYRLLKDW